MARRNYENGRGILGSVPALTVNIDSSGAAQAGDDLIAMADTAGVEYALMLGNGTNINDLPTPDSGYTVELKIPFASFSYPENLGDSVLFIGALANDIDAFEDVASNYYAWTWWFKYSKGQLSPAWAVLGPENPAVGINDDVYVPTKFQLFNNFPNPFNPTTTIKYSINVNADVTLSVYNILGQLITVLKKTNVPAGFNEFKFNAGSLSSGVYFYKVNIKNLNTAETFDSQVKKMILLK